MKKEIIQIKGPKIFEKRVLSFEIISSKNLEKYFSSKNLIIEYPADIASLDPSINRIPALASIITVAWIVGADVSVESIDHNYFKSINEIKSVMKKWYPPLSFSSEIITREVNNHSPASQTNKYGLLYSAGLDSTTSYIKHRKKDLILFSISGQGESIDNQLTTEKILIPLPEKKEKFYLIKTNIENVINRSLIQEKYGLNWWMNLSHGIVLSGHCAPLTYLHGISTLFLASSFTSDFNYAWGSHPLIDNKIRWANTKIVHDGFDTTRQEKIKHILKKYINETGEYPKLKVCSNYQIRGQNCSKCEKCSRTIVGLLSEAIDPDKCGFNITPGTLSYIKKSLQNGGFFGRRGIAERSVKLIDRIYPIFEWEDIQRHLPEQINWDDNYGSMNFLNWFRHFDIRRRATRINLHKFPQLILYSFFDFLAPASPILPKKIQNLLRFVFNRLFLNKKSYSHIFSN